MDKLEVLCRAWIDCDPNRGYVDPDEKLGNTYTEDLRGQPHWHWFKARAIELERYIEERGYVIVPLDQMPSYQLPSFDTMNDRGWGRKRERLEEALRAAALALQQHTGANAFSIELADGLIVRTHPKDES